MRGDEVVIIDAESNRTYAAEAKAPCAVRVWAPYGFVRSQKRPTIGSGRLMRPRRLEPESAARPGPF